MLVPAILYKEQFPSPLRGLIFHSLFAFYCFLSDAGFRPLFGDLSSIRLFQLSVYDRFSVSVPSSGTYLPFIFVGGFQIGTEEFPSPLRGLIFHS